MTYRPDSKRWEHEPAREELGLQAATTLTSGTATQLVQAHNTALVLASAGTARRFRGHESLVTQVVADPRCSYLFSASQSGELRAWSHQQQDLANPSLQHAGSGFGVTNAVYSADGKYLLAPLEDDVAVLETGTLKPVSRIPGGQRPIAASATDAWVLTHQSDRILQWSLRDRKLVRDLGLESGNITHAIASANCRWLAALNSTGALFLFDLHSAQPQQPIRVERPLPDRSPQVIDDSGTRLWSISRLNDLTCHELPGGRLLWRKALDARPTSVCHFGGRGQIAVALLNGEIQFHNERDGQRISSISSGSTAAQALAKTQDETRLVAAGIEGELHVIAAESGLYLTRLQTGTADPLRFATVAPNGAAIAILTKTGLLRELQAR
ncbi:MAG: hypothetical protein V4773_24430 [Verrucomicrobiota bacterium]